MVTEFVTLFNFIPDGISESNISFQDITSSHQPSLDVSVYLNFLNG